MLVCFEAELHLLVGFFCSDACEPRALTTCHHEQRKLVSRPIARHFDYHLLGLFNP